MAQAHGLDVNFITSRAFSAESCIALSFSSGPGSSELFNDIENLRDGEGILPLLKEIARKQQSCANNRLNATIRISFIELMGRTCRDLLATSSECNHVCIKDSDVNKQPHISGVEEVSCHTASEMLDCLRCGLSNASKAADDSAVARTDKDDAEPNHQADCPEKRTELIKAESYASSANYANRIPHSHLIFTIQIVLQGPRAAMPIQAASSQAPIPPPLPPQRSFTAPKSSSQASGKQSDAQGQDEFLLRSTIRIVDIWTGTSSEEKSCSPSDESSAFPATEADLGLVSHEVSATSMPSPIPATPADCGPSPVLETTAACQNSSDACVPPNTHSATPSIQPAARDLGQHLTLRTSSRRLLPQVPNPGKGSGALTPRRDYEAPAPQQYDHAPATSSSPSSGLEALKRLLDPNTHGTVYMRCRVHPLTRLLSPALAGMCHRLIVVPEKCDTETEVLLQQLQELPQLNPKADMVAVDTQSDVMKWMRYENHTLRSELKVARSRISLMQKYVATRGAREVKTWDLWKSLQSAEDTAADLRKEVETLEAALSTARGAVDTANAAVEAAEIRAATEAARSAGVLREAANALARADAMEAAVDRMALQLADVATSGVVAGDSAQLTDGAPGGVGFGGQVEEQVENPPNEGDGCPAAPCRVSVRLHVVRGYVGVRIRTGTGKRQGRPSDQKPVSRREKFVQISQAYAELASRVSAAEERHKSRSHSLAMRSSVWSHKNSASVGHALSLMNMLAHILLDHPPAAHASLSTLVVDSTQELSPSCSSPGGREAGDSRDGGGGGASLKLKLPSGQVTSPSGSLTWESPKTSRSAGSSPSGAGRAHVDFESGLHAWPVDLGTSPAEWMAALALVPHLPELLQWQLDTVLSDNEVHGNAELQKQQQLTKHDLMRAERVVGVLLPPFTSPSLPVLHSVWGWLKPWCEGRKQSSGRSKGQFDSGSRAASNCAENCGHVHGPRSNGTMCVEVDAKHASTGNWTNLACVLHDMLGKACKGQQLVTDVVRKHHSSEVCMLQETLQAHKMTIEAQAQKSNKVEARLEELEHMREDAEARAQVFDDTVKNLVNAKMAHATADITIRSMRDQIEALSIGALGPDANLAPVKKSAVPGVSSWRLRASRWRSSGDSATVPSELSSAVSRSAAAARSALSNLTSYFHSKQNGNATASS